MSCYQDDPEKRASYERWLAESASGHRAFKPSSGRSKATRLNLRSAASLVVLEMERQLNGGRQLTQEDE